MRVLCLDPSFTCLGWAILETSNQNKDLGKLIDFGTIEQPASLKLSETQRLWSLLFSLKAILKRDIDYVIREEVVGSKSAKANRLLNMLKGGIIGLTMGTSIPEISYTARQTKMSLTGSQDAQKSQIVEAVSQRFPELKTIRLAKFRMEAVCDALALYIIWMEGKIEQCQLK